MYNLRTMGKLETVLEGSYGFSGVTSAEKTQWGATNVNHSFMVDGIRFHHKLIDMQDPETLRRLEFINRIVGEVKNEQDFAELTTPIAATDGSPYIIDEDGIHLVYPWVEGYHITTDISTGEASSYGRVLGKFHRSFRQYTEEALILISEKPRDYQVLENPALQATLERIIDDPEKIEKYRNAFDFVMTYEAPDSEVGVLHGDTDFSNYIFRDGEVVAILDFDSMRTGHTEEEVIITLIKSFVGRGDVTLRDAEMKAFLEAYRSETTLNISPENIDYFIYKFIVGSVLSFLPRVELGNKEKETFEIICKVMLQKLSIYEQNKEQVHAAILK